MNMTKTREIEHLSNQIAQQDKDYEIQKQELLKQKELLYLGHNILAAHQEREVQQKALEVQADGLKVENSNLFEEKKKTQEQFYQSERRN